ncbi:unnamed protein product [Mytilus coruscus]|uniref:G-protein coupled receptors family 1 profile domain-containing protein n=1 Tax=Mytilus coruscus TaxID=42192 RepID=A0A6J8DYB2_MYTCO|nr:unnamed protein product [Mytilus coruscus]
MTLIPLTYECDVLCKSGWLLGSTTTFILCLFSYLYRLQRYLKVCRRKGPMMTLKWRKIVMICALFMSAVISRPSVVTYGLITFQSRNRNVTGLKCGKITGTASIIYDAVLGVNIILCCGLLILPYCLIAWKTYKYLKKVDQSEVELQSCIKNKNSENQIKQQSISTLESELKTEYNINLFSNEQLSNKIISDMGENSLRNYSKVIKKQPKKLRMTN